MKQMKKILFVAQMKNYGGVERSLINLLGEIPSDRYDVTVAVLGACGSIVEEIPRWMTVKKIDGQDPKQYAKRLLKTGRLIKGVRNLWEIVKVKATKKISFRYYDASSGRYAAPEEHYDVAIAWAMPDAFENLYVLKSVHADKRLMWIHMDLAHYEMPSDSAKYLKRYDRFVCVSHACRSSFDAGFPTLAERSVILYNIIDREVLLTMAQKETEERWERERFSIVTCGRLAKEKRPLLAIDICRALVREGMVNFTWYFIGDGPLRAPLADAITENHLQDHVILLGSCANPYPFVRQADLYVQMSRHESFCLTLAEAQLLGVPAVTTDFPAAHEIVEHGSTGYIVEQSGEALAAAIKGMLVDQTDLQRLRQNAQGIDHKKFSGSFSQLETILF